MTKTWWVSEGEGKEEQERGILSLKQLHQSLLQSKVAVQNGKFTYTLNDLL